MVTTAPRRPAAPPTASGPGSPYPLADDDEEAAPPAAPSRRELPAWPLTLLFVGFPVWWLLGLGAFAAPIAASVMAMHMLLRGGVRVPRRFGIWVLFLVWVIAAGTQIDSFGRAVGFVFTYMNYAAASVVFVYVYNCPRDRLPIRRVLGMVVVFWVWVVIGGFLGVLLPKMGMTTPFERVLPGAIKGNEYVHDLVHPQFAEIQQPWGAPRPYNRPRAPFPYTNAWGSHFALLFPFVVLYVTQARSTVRMMLIGLMCASLVPAFATLNRGMFLAIVVGVLYTAIRYLSRGHVRWPAMVIALMVVGGIAALLSGVGAGIDSRTEYSSTTNDRLGLYTESFVRTLESPVLGYGAPRPSNTYVVSVGTQGEFWHLMFSYGFPGLLFFCGWIWLLAMRTRRVLPDSLLWLHAVLVMASFMLFYYSLDQTELVLVFLAAALILRGSAGGTPGGADDRGAAAR
ncbi:O-antigen ligase domain-containing protein [Actinomadura darangshiensis]|uniref:O-antigen ligase domain-containing protein n=1 Tax=Actinomadura darangshiensis TaxID=705336 RepID=A0A4R5BXQ9_9ACTN|nr:O-antigen ligase family protein [Actinomadura darangshiensis]TDD90180.1 O-antigen ligase domain-containing protein [Actinomadura darangshiensis]